MKFTQRKIKWLTRLVLIAGLFTQGIVAAQACVSPVASAAYALSAQSVDATMPCHQAEKHNVNACLIHCTQTAQVNLDPHTTAAEAVREVVLLVAMPQVSHELIALLHPPLVLNTGPSLSIRFCSFLI